MKRDKITGNKRVRTKQSNRIYSETFESTIFITTLKAHRTCKKKRKKNKIKEVEARQCHDLKRCCV